MTIINTKMDLYMFIIIRKNLIKIIFYILILFFSYCKSTADTNFNKVDALTNFEEFKIREATLINDKEELEKWCILYLEKKESHQIYSILANIYKDKNNFPYAEYYASLALEREKSIENYLLIISILNARGKYNEMIEYYEELINLDYQYEFLYNLSELYFFIKNYNKSNEYLELSFMKGLNEFDYFKMKIDICFVLNQTSCLSEYSEKIKLSNKNFQIENYIFSNNSLDKALYYLKNNQIDLSIFYLEKYTELNPTNIDILTLLVDLYFKEERNKSGLDLAHKVLTLKELNFSAMQSIIKYYTKKNELDNFKNFIYPYYRKYPKDKNINYFMGIYKKLNNNQDEAIQYFKRAILYGHQSDLAYYDLVNLLILKKDYQNALIFLNKIENEISHDITKEYNLYIQAQLLQEQGDFYFNNRLYEESLVNYLKSEKYFISYQSKYKIGLVYFYLNDISNSIKYFLESVKLNNSNNNLSYIYLSLFKKKKKINLSDIIFPNLREKDIAFGLGLEFESANLFLEALNQYKKIIINHKDDKRFLNEVSKKYLYLVEYCLINNINLDNELILFIHRLELDKNKLDRFQIILNQSNIQKKIHPKIEKAESLFLKNSFNESLKLFLEIEEKFISVDVVLGILKNYFRLNRKEEGVQYIKKFNLFQFNDNIYKIINYLIEEKEIKLSENLLNQLKDRAEDNNLFYYHLSKIYLYQGKTIKSEEFIQKALLLNPDHEDSKFLKLDILILKNEKELIKIYLDKIRQSIKNQNELKYYEAYYYFTINEFEQSKKLIKENLKISNSRKSYELLYNIYFKQKNYKKALSVLTKISEIFPNIDLSSKKLDLIQLIKESSPKLKFSFGVESLSIENSLFEFKSYPIRDGLISEPIVSNKNFYFTFKNAILCENKDQKKEVWRLDFSENEIIKKIDIHDKYLYVFGDRFLLKLNPENGNLIYKKVFLSNILSFSYKPNLLLQLENSIGSILLKIGENGETIKKINLDSNTIVFQVNSGKVFLIKNFKDMFEYQVYSSDLEIFNDKRTLFSPVSGDLEIYSVDHSSVLIQRENYFYKIDPNNQFQIKKISEGSVIKILHETQNSLIYTKEGNYYLFDKNIFNEHFIQSTTDKIVGLDDKKIYFSDTNYLYTIIKSNYKKEYILKKNNLDENSIIQMVVP
jgi:tetratricopeptide (TPR) repeat protein